LDTFQSHPLQRAEQLLVALKARYQQFVSQLPLPLGELARQQQTYFDSIEGVELENPPAALRLPWLFWEIFEAVPDDNFLDVAEGGAYFFLASILFDHLVDGQVEDPGILALLQRAFWVQGAARFRAVFKFDSPFWGDYDRLLAEHQQGLAAERHAQVSPETFTIENLKAIAGSKICPGMVSLAGLAHIAQQTHLLVGLEKALKAFAVGTQFIDDVQDWRDDLAAGHLTHFLTCAAPETTWGKSTWPPEVEVEALINATLIDLDHWQMGIEHFTQAIQGVYNLNCPGWTDYVFEERRKAQVLWDHATAKLLLRSFETLSTGTTQDTAPAGKKGSAGNSAPTSAQGSPELRAIDALLSAQQYDGAWVDFDIPGLGVSDTWVTAHVGLKLASLPESLINKQLRGAIKSAAHFLNGKWRHGWGYNDHAPVDADTTSHAILFYAKAGIAPPPSTIPALLGFQRTNGGFATYDKFRDPSMPESWCVAHPDVTPVALRALLPYQEDQEVTRAVSAAIQRMESDRLLDGTWPAFWWILRWYTTAAWMETWQMLPKFRHPLGAFPPIKWEQTCLNFYGCTSTLDEALLLECAIYSGSPNIAAQVGVQLVETQLPNGLWPVEPALCQTTPGVYQPWELEKRETLYPEEVGIYSSASILHALALLGELGDREIS
jgi:hypothetical protein